MARKKQVKKEPTKKTPTKKRRKKREKSKGLKIPPPLGPQECNGYKVGQEVYCYRSPDKKLAYGRITTFHPDDVMHDKIIPCFTFIDQVTGQFRTAIFEDIIDEPAEKIKRKVLLAMSKNRS